MIAYILAAAIIVQQVIHAVERKDLYNRIMAKDLHEYKADNKTRTVPNMIKKRLEQQKGE